MKTSHTGRERCSIRSPISSLRFSCRVSVEAQPVLSVSPTSVTVQANFGTNAPSQTVQVQGTGKTERSSRRGGRAVERGPWLSVSPTNGVNNGTLTLTSNTSTLAAGTAQTRRSSSRARRARRRRSTCRRPSSAPPPPPPALTANCPANKTVASPNGSQLLSPTLSPPHREERLPIPPAARRHRAAAFRLGRRRCKSPQRIVRSPRRPPAAALR